MSQNVLLEEKIIRLVLSELGHPVGEVDVAKCFT